MIKDFTTYIREGLFDRNQSEFVIKKTDKGIEQIYIPKTKEELYSYIDIDIEQAKRDGTYPNVNLNNIDVSELGDDSLEGLFSYKIYMINPDISNWDIKYIPKNFFDSNDKIEEFTIPNSVKNIGNFSFQYCSNLTSITIPNSVTSIGMYAFDECSSLTSITIPNSVTSIGWGAFEECSGLTSITIPNSVTSIGMYAFEGCGGLESVIIPNSVTSIGEEAFSWCGNLKSVTIPNSVKNIGEEAFAWCNCLTSVTIPKKCGIVSSSFPKDCKIIRK